MNLEYIARNASTPGSFAAEYFKYVAHVLSKIDTGAIERFVQVLLDARERGARIFFIGNGGSAATASHFANDVSIGTRSRSGPFRALSLADNVAAMTAIANDSGYEDIFVQQLRAQMTSGDVVVAISASGNSPNVLKAVEYANTNGGITVGITGFDGGRLRSDVALSIHAPTEPGEYGPAEDAHMAIDHVVYSYLLRRG